MNFELISHDVLETAENFITTSFSDIGQYLLNNVAIAIFLCLGLGYVLGKLKIKSFSIGPTVGTLVVGLLIS
ncbi:MAG: aspartate-alanine antiporter, partial [Oscillospiraceae bacterium]